ncbi:exosome component 10 [Homalodisca vitripennis]|uniref:exosome component 10 n=1 Tax=Homalodisca vitripennis TaxID=197043 RepID=UPI001EEBFCC8|nr:exosome component 10 [Homalodisca vitripennis]
MDESHKDIITVEDGDEKSSKDFMDIVKEGYDALMPTIRASNSLPKGQQWDLFCTSPKFKDVMDSLGNKALELMAVILHHQGVNRDIRKRDLEEKYELVVEANDKILERVGTHLDELSGIKRNNPSGFSSDIVVSQVSAASGSWNRDIANSAAWKEVRHSKNPEKPMVLKNARVTQRPQVKFHDKIDNSSVPFEPRIKEKPNSLKPLAILLESLPNEDACYSHPYEFEIERFQDKIDSFDLDPKKPTPPKPIEETPLLTITQEDQLMDMLKDLHSQKEIAVDLEHHSYRSFQGFTCLMQISTREKDYIIDTLELRHKLYVLNEVFTNPKIVKVFHGADSDVQWLQRDLCLYVVNMFDTYQASLLLSLPRLSLAFLLKTFCNIDANKHFQLYDWRTRPLSKEAIKYAREDTHYLLYIYDMLWNKLLEKSSGGPQLLQSALFRSADTCKKRYWKSIFKENSHEHMYYQSKKNFDNRQMFAFKELYAWRDKTAREEDESTGYVLPNHMLLLIAEKLPKEMQGILACCNPIPPLVRQNLVLLHQLILKAREQPLVAEVALKLNSENHARPVPQANVNLDGALHCPHDLTHSMDFRDDLPTLLNNALSIDTNHNATLLQSKPTLSVFGDEDASKEPEGNNSSKVNLPNQIHFMSPFERYKKMLTYLEDEKKKSKEEREQELIRDTQKLLDECMREKQRSSAAGTCEILESPADEVLKVKEETQDYNPRKRDRSQDSSNYNTPIGIKSGSNHGETSRKSKKTKILNKPKMTAYEEFKAQLFNTPVTIKNEDDASVRIKNEDDTTVDRCSPPKKRKVNNKIEVVPVSVGKKPSSKTVTNKTSSETFIKYDYSQVDFSKFQSPQLSAIPKSSQSKFKHKGKKKQQNKSFTFVRQYGNNSGKK